MRGPSRKSSLESWLRLARAPGIGPRILGPLLERFGSADAVLGATESELQSVSRLGPVKIRSLLDASRSNEIFGELERAEALRIRLLPLDSEEYPSLLRILPCPPPVLAIRGEIKALDDLALTVVGPRAPSDYARRMTGRIIPPLSSRGLTIVSGLAQGIDAEAHHAALNAGGRTLAVLGQGLDTPLYPSSNRSLADRILREKQGAILSPFALSERPQPGLYPQRNEILAALGLGLLVMEAGDRSGALITARHAADFGRTVLVLPGDADRTTARGSNRLLADGAMLVQSSDEVLASLSGELRETLNRLGGESPGFRATTASPSDSDPGIKAPRSSENVHQSARIDAGDEVGQTLSRLLSEEHRPLDVLLQGCAEAGFSHSAVIQKLLELEMCGVLEQLPGRIYRRRG